jgi:ATP-binding cassette subfamily B protein
MTDPSPVPLPKDACDARARIAALAWPAERLGEALDALATRSGLAGPSAARRDRDGLPRLGGTRDELIARLDTWLAHEAASRDLEAEPFDAAHGDIAAVARWSAPAILLVESSPELDAGIRCVAVLKGGRRTCTLLTPDHSIVRVPAALLAEALQAPPGAEARVEAELLLDAAGVPNARRKRSRDALLAQTLRGKPRRAGWILRSGSASTLGARVREARLGALGLGFFALEIIRQALWIGSWWLIGRAALGASFDHGWLIAWGLVLASLVPLQVAATAVAGRIAIRASAILERLVLHGSFRLDPEEVRGLGVGGLLGRIVEAEAVGELAIAGGFLTVAGLIELGFAAAILALGAGAWLALGALAAWIALVAAFALAYVARRKRWTDRRLDLTNGLVEGMVGHRTRLAQEAPERWSEEEDAELAEYVGSSRALDDAAVRLQALAPRGWLVLGLLSLVPAFVVGGDSLVDHAVAIGGVLVGHQALRRLGEGLEHAIGAWIAWRQVRPFELALRRREPLGHPGVTANSTAHAASVVGVTDTERAQPDERRTALELREVSFRYASRAEPVVTHASLRVRHGDRVLLEGPSGGGKSTLATVLAASRTPSSGLVLLDGLDLETIGSEAWRRRVVLVPQFHENHVFLGTLAFNSLLGRAWPPTEADLKDAEAVCAALGLGPLIERMPGGLMQLVGETGWQLSHGEQSRLFLARALLQRAEIIILDESFAALDPDTLRIALGHVVERAPTLIAIAHP